MTSTVTQLDPNLYRLVEQMTGEPGAERRHQPRSAYGVVQRIAPWTGQQSPRRAGFLPVVCHDLNQGGFSFLTPNPPQCDTLVVELGPQSAAIYVLARVMHCHKVVLYPSGKLARAGAASKQDSADQAASGGIPLTLVGCRFLRRLRTPEAEEHAG